ncbi:MAG TPA: GNAT family N-acetyltransferase [Thermoanaerobaculia bacterium]|nr:GNAT family N-acetyltransferase [Thermoanaerobaculia bacterium]
MAGYRFCRSDDAGLLVEAFNHCAASLEEPVEPLTDDAFKRLGRELDLWTSSCMVAQAQGEPIAVLLAAKREEENLIHALVVHAEHQRQGHGRHLLTSLSQKMAILGPPRLIAELPEERIVACRFVEACGYRPEAVLTDFEHPGGGEPPGAEGALIVEVGWSELEQAGLLASTAARCWGRAIQTLRHRRDELRGRAVLSERRVEAFLLDRPDRRGGVEIAAFGCAQPERAAPLAALLVRALCARSEGPVRLPGAHPDELPFAVLSDLGFGPRERTVVYATEAVGREQASP